MFLVLVLLWSAVVLGFLAAIAANKKPSPDRLPAKDLRFLSRACFVIGVCLWVISR